MRHPIPNLLPAVDPRIYQVSVLCGFVAWGSVFRGFDIQPRIALAILAAALATQAVAGRLVGLPRFDARSALITGLSLTLLLRVDSVALAVVAAIIAIGSKFTVRIGGKHLFNPANIAIVMLMLATDSAWVSPGQWGNATLVAFGVAGLGAIVLNRARRAEATIGFLLTWAALLLLRALWLGDPLAIPFHQLQNAALLVFAFFMISDPKTTPDSSRGRLLHAALVAACAFVLQYVFYINHGPLLALAACAPLVPLIDRVQRRPAYEWQPAMPVRTDVEGVIKCV